MLESCHTAVYRLWLLVTETPRLKHNPAKMDYRGTELTFAIQIHDPYHCCKIALQDLCFRRIEWINPHKIAIASIPNLLNHSGLEPALIVYLLAVARLFATLIYSQKMLTARGR